MRGNQGVARLAGALDEHIRRRTQRPDPLELGTIQEDMSLKVDRFEMPIPAGQYLVCRAADGPLQPGDRVLVGWVNDGTDPTVIDVLQLPV